MLELNTLAHLRSSEAAEWSKFTTGQIQDSRYGAQVNCTYLNRINTTADCSILLKFHKEYRATAIKFTSSSAVAQRERAAGWVSYGQNWKTGTGRQYLRTL